MLTGPLAITTPIAGFNGGVFVNPDLSLIEARTLPAEVARDVIAVIDEHELDAWVYAGGDWLVRKRDAPHVDREMKTVQFAPTVVADFGERLDEAVKIVGVSDDADRIGACADAIRERFGTQVSAALSQPYYLDVTHPNANKGCVVAELVKRLGIPAEAIATIGDMANDVDMFEKGGFSIAMGNASDEVKAKADVVTADCDHDGFAEAVERYVLPTARAAE